MTEFTAVIPARLKSTRLPGKPLSDIAGHSMVEWVAAEALKSGASEAIVATDSDRIASAVNLPGVKTVLTSEKHSSGTERIAEVIEKEKIPSERIIVNVQGDEPLMDPEVIRRVADLLDSERTAAMATAAVPITDERELLSPDAVKIALAPNGFALYFSRAPIPYDRDNFRAGKNVISAGLHVRHLGIYAYRAGFVRDYVRLPEGRLEHLEKLEQLRALEYGFRIKVALLDKTPPAGVDTKEDLDRIVSFIRENGIEFQVAV